MAIDRNSKLYGEQSPSTLLEKRKGQAEVKELYDKINNLESTIIRLENSLQTVSEVASTVDNTINNLISNSSFSFSHRVYSMASYYNSHYMLAKWYTRPSGYTTSWVKNTDGTESTHSIRSFYGYPPDEDSITWAFPGYQLNYGVPSRFYDWRWSEGNYNGTNYAAILKLQIESTDPTNKTLKVITEGFAPSVGQTIRLKDASVLSPLPDNVSGVLKDKTYWIADVTTVSGTKYIKLTDSPIPVAPQVPVYVSVSKTGASDAFIYAFVYVEPTDGSMWDVRSGTLRTTGGYTVATHLSEKKLKVGEKPFFQCRLTHIPTVFQVSFNSTRNVAVCTNHGFADGTKILFFSAGNTLPPELVLGTTYYVVSSSRDEFQIAETAGGEVIDLTTDGAGEMLVRSLLSNDVTMKVSIWDNANNRILRGDRPVLNTTKIGSHRIEDTLSGKTYKLGPSSGMYIYEWRDLNNAFYSITDQITWPFPQEDYPDNNYVVKILDSGDGIPNSLSIDKYYYLKWKEEPITFTLSEMIGGTSISLSSDSFNGKTLDFYMYESISTEYFDRKYILEVVLEDDRKLYSDSQVFVEGQNLITDTVNPNTQDNQNAVTVSWVDIPNATSYNIYRAVGDSDEFKLIGSTGPGNSSIIDFGGSLEATLNLPSITDEYNLLYTAEVRIPAVTETIADLPLVSVPIVKMLQLPTVISDISTSGDQFLQIEFLRPDGTQATKADIPNYSLAIDEIGLSLLNGSWSPSAADNSLKPIPILPREVIPRGRGFYDISTNAFGRDPNQFRELELGNFLTAFWGYSSYSTYGGYNGEYDSRWGATRG